MSQELALSLFSDLRSPDVSIRFSVLARLENISWDNELINAFAVLTRTESDPTVKLYMRLILERAGRKPAAAIDTQAMHQELARLIEQPGLDPLRLALLLEMLPADSASATGETLANRALNDYPAIILPFVLRFIRKHRLTAFTRQITALCNHRDPQILSAAVETLEKIEPQQLEPLLVPLLTNSNPAIRSRAVRLLYRLDRQEALKHFEFMLLSPDIGDRNAAMFHAYFFPFALIEPALLQFMAVESDPELLKKAGYLFQVNPALEPPLNLIEIIEGSSGSKREIFSEILKGVLNARSRLLNRPVDELLAELKAACRNKKGSELVAQCRLAWETAGPAQRHAIAGKLEQLARSGITAASEALNDLAVQTTGTSPEKPQEISAADLNRLSASERINIWKASDDVINRLQNEISVLWPTMNPEEKTVILSRILQTRCLSLARAIGHQALQDKNEIVVAATIETLQVLDPDIIFPLLPRLLAHPSTAVQSAAISVHSIYDKDQAVRLLEKMLGSNPVARASALFHLAQFDFPSVEKILMNCLKSEDNTANLQKIEAILSSNLDDRLLFQVFSLSRAEKGPRRAAIENMFSRLAGTLLERGGDQSKTLVGLIDTLTEQLNREKQKEACAPAWSLENIQKLRQQKAAPTPLPDAAGENITAFALGTFAISGLVAWLLWAAVLNPLLPETPQTQNRTGRAGETTLTGTVEKVLPFAIEIKPDKAADTLQIVLPKVHQGRRLEARVRKAANANQAELLELINNEK